jgi:hypothetical protein
MHPQTKVLLAVAIGTQYAVRLSPRRLHEGLPDGMRVEIVWSAGTTLNVRHEFGAEWVVGTFAPEEVRWCEESYDEQEASK